MIRDGVASHPDHYAVLGLAGKEGRPLSTPEAKQAYKRALLEHHPDKQLPEPQTRQSTNSRTVTVDDIALAYKILSEPDLRAEYDREIQARAVSGAPSEQQVYHTGLETVDLDDLEFDDDSEQWTRGCRCGKSKAYVVTEPELEKNLADGELITGCRGCSLWLRVLFGAEDQAPG